MKTRSILLIILCSFGTSFANENTIEISPFVIQELNGWKQGRKIDSIRANGTVLEYQQTNEPSTQIVFLNSSTPASTEQDHITHFKMFLNNIRNAYPNASISHIQMLDQEVPFISVYDLQGDSFFWGTVRYEQTSYDIAVTTHQRSRQLPASARQLLESVRPAQETSLSVPTSD